ncbi:ferritin-like domain-containing protein [Nannocystis punicea]|uniref:Ferritin-like domain-containing protein n=1 Tax=Nannocystis punicea TaxID=2995304 RepID=A0ABY7GWQ6_9BACT|nr:ferritin-like domain-containing protein [Nannocystis poenicansa]WAS91418.1 ferritin-like domain-containing protein [Nannocystis poenicansa]
MAFSDLDRFARAFTAALAPLIASCGIEEDQFDVDICSERFLSMVEPETPVDYFELRSVPSYGDPELDQPITVIDSVGEKCATASDEAACLAAFDALPTESQFVGVGNFDSPEVRLFAWSRADEVGAITDMAGLLAFLGSVDTAGEAALVGRLAGHELLCSEPHQVGDHPEGHVLYTTSGSGCGSKNDIVHHVVLVRTDGSISVLDSKRIQRGDPNCAIGRLPPGLCRPLAPAASRPVGAFFAEVAHLEAASVPAFAHLARELRAHGAPDALRRAALRSRDDERRHARLTARLARRFGGQPSTPRVRPTPLRPLVEVLADNAAEGCVRETFGALVAHVQARRAGDPQVRRTLARIAGDETRHAALSWGLARWARGRMRTTERQHVARAHAEALERLAGELTREHDAEVHALAGLPEPAEAQALFASLRDALRSEARA